MAKRHPVPRLLLISDARNDAFLARALARLPRGARGQGASGLVFRHYHLDPPARARRFAALRKLARAHGVMLIAAGPPCGRGAQGRYGAPGTLARVPGPQSGLRLATAHNGREIGQAVRARADAVLLSPVFPRAAIRVGGCWEACALPCWRRAARCRFWHWAAWTRRARGGWWPRMGPPMAGPR
jgi:hypothetical protein